MSEQMAGTERVVIPRARLHQNTQEWRSNPRARLRPAPRPVPEARREELFEGLYTLRELGEAFQIGWRSMYGWCAQGMPYIKVGNRRLFDLVRVREWMLSREIDRSPRPVGRPRKNTRR